MNEAALRRLIREVISEGFPTELHIFDFDGTLVRTPTPEEGKPVWEAATGESWPHKGWWGQTDSLDLSIFDMPVISSTVSAFNKAMANPNAHVMVLTGRHKGMHKEVQAILDANGLKPHELNLCKSMHSTLPYKLNVLRSWAQRVPLEKIVMWEDRAEHIGPFEAMSDELRIPVEVHHVT